MINRMLFSLKNFKSINTVKQLSTFSIREAGNNKSTSNLLVFSSSHKNGNGLSNFPRMINTMSAQPEHVNKFKSLFAHPKLNLTTIESFLYKVPFIELSSLLKTEVDMHTKNTALHLAVAEGNIELVEMLMSFDASAHVKNYKNETPITLATNQYKAALDSQQREKYKRIKSLIESREAWQLNNSQAAGIHLNRTLRLLEQGKKELMPLTQDVVLLCGLTQRGKSAIANYIQGTNYIVDISSALRLKTNIMQSGGRTPVASVGNFITSETLYPQVIPIPNESFSLVDMPGVEENRGSEEMICINTSVQLLIQQLGNKKVKGIVMVCSAHDLVSDPGFNNYKKAAKYLRSQLKTDNIILAVTHGEQSNHEVLKNNILSNLTEIEKIARKELASKDITHHDYHEKNCILEVTQSLLEKNGDKIIITNILNPDLRPHIIDKIKRLSGQHHKLDFNFEFMKANLLSSTPFKSLIKHLLECYNGLIEVHAQQTSKLETIENNITIHQNELQTLKDDKDKIKASIDACTQDAASNSGKITTNESNIVKYGTSIEVAKNVLSHLKEKYESKKNEIKELTNDSDEKLESIVINTVQKRIDSPFNPWNLFSSNNTDAQVKEGGVNMRYGSNRYSYMSHNDQYTTKFKRIGLIVVDPKVTETELFKHVESEYDLSPHFIPSYFIRHSNKLYFVSNTASQEGGFSFQDDMIKKIDDNLKIDPSRPTSFKLLNQHDLTFIESLISRPSLRCEISRVELSKNHCEIKINEDYGATGKLFFHAVGNQMYFGEVGFGIEVYGYKRNSNEILAACDVIKKAMTILVNKRVTEEQVKAWREEELEDLKNNLIKLQNNPSHLAELKEQFEASFKVKEQMITKKTNQITNLNEAKNMQKKCIEDASSQYEVNHPFFTRLKELLEILSLNNDPEVNDFINHMNKTTSGQKQKQFK